MMVPDEKNNWSNSIIEETQTDVASVRDLYDEFSSDYNKTLVDWQYNAPEVAARLMQDHLNSDAVILDAGCGTGLTGAALKTSGFINITGIDLSEKSVAAARQANIYTSVLMHDMTKPQPFSDKSFDGVFCIGVLAYLPDLEPVLSEFLRVIRHGGIVVFSQRDDLYENRCNAELFAAMEKRNLFKSIITTDPLPYMPGHPDFEDRIKVRYFVWQKT